MVRPLQAIVLAAASSMLVIVSCWAQLAERPSPSSTSTDVASAPLHRPSCGFLYTMQYRIGKTTVSGVIDTGSDLIWTSTSTQLFDSAVRCSSDARQEMGMSCCLELSTFERQYGGHLEVRGVIGKAELTFALDKPSYTIDIGSAIIGSAIMFGCPLSCVQDKDTFFLDNVDIDISKQTCKAYQRGGIVGLGRGERSLVRQLGLHSFSYCLPHQSTGSASQGIGQIRFNDAAPLEGTQSTDLVPYPDSRYYVKLEKIVIGPRKTEVILRNDCLKREPSSGNPGMIIDSGTAFTTLPKKAFNAVKGHVEDVVMKKRKTGSEPIEAPWTNGDKCYPGKYPDDMGNIVLQFCGGAHMEIPAKNYLYEMNNGFCLAINLADEGSDGLLGVYQQQGMYMLFDIQNNKLTFAKHSACGQSQEENHATL